MDTLPPKVTGLLPLPSPSREVRVQSERISFEHEKEQVGKLAIVFA